MTQPDSPDHDEQQLGVEVDAISLVLASSPCVRDKTWSTLPQGLQPSRSPSSTATTKLSASQSSTYEPTVYPPAQRPSLAAATLSQRLQFHHTLPMGNRDNVF